MSWSIVRRYGSKSKNPTESCKCTKNLGFFINENRFVSGFVGVVMWRVAQWFPGLRAAGGKFLYSLVDHLYCIAESWKKNFSLSRFSRFPPDLLDLKSKIFFETLSKNDPLSPTAPTHQYSE